MDAKIRVEATELGYYDHMRRRAGDVFDVFPKKTKSGRVMSPKEQLSKRWMKVVPDETPEKISLMTKVSSANLDEHNSLNLANHPVAEIKESNSNSQEELQDQSDEKSSGDEEVI